jgi:chromosome segregation ATPase
MQGQLGELEEKLSQREASIESLNGELETARGEASGAMEKLSALSEDAASAIGMKNTLQAEIDALSTQIAELRARWDMLYQVAEDEPAFKAYFVVADKTHWFPLTHLSSALGIPTVRLKRQLQKFIDVGLLEIDADRIRPLNLSDVAKKAATSEEQLIEEAKAEIEEMEGSLEEEESATDVEEIPEDEPKDDQ